MDRYIGRLLDNRYEILEIIGTGGMAVVYKARCHRLNRLVAIKILKDEFSKDEEFRRRFRAEGEAVAMLSHPNIVAVYDVSSTDDANYIVMELIDGITLKQYMGKKGVLNWKETLHFAMQIGKALEHAHGRGIIHRDIKPHNVMVLKNGSVKVADFGIARVVSKSNTLTKEALGSVHYISPEQAKGGWVDNRSDIYSLGVVMYEMMSGRPPYDGESPVAVAIQHINGGAIKPSTLNPNIPVGMEQIIMKAMALDPKKRYISATQMLNDMDEFRQNPNMQFYSGADKDATQVIPSVAAIAHQPRNTAERVAGTSAGAAAAAAARARMQAAAQHPHTGNTGKLPRAGAVPPVTRMSSQEAARRAAAARAEEARKQEAARRAAEEEAKRSRITTIAVISCCAVAIIAIIVFLIALSGGGLFGGSKMLLEVPDLEGEVYSSISENQYEGFDIVLYERIYHETVEEGKVISQRPDAGDRVKEGTDIYLTVSMGPEPEKIIMENLIGISQTQAEEFLKDQGVVPLVRTEASDEYAVGQVVRTDPEAETELTEGQTVYVWVSAGPEVETAKMQNVVGMQYDVAYNLLTQMGFMVITQTPAASEEDVGKVIEQSAEANTEIDVTTPIVLTVSTGPEIITAKMPNVVGQQYEVAYTALTQLGFINVDYDYAESDEEKDEVIEQPVDANTEVDVTTEIVLIISEGPKEPEPDPEEGAEYTNTFTIELPDDMEEDYMLGLYQDDEPVMDEEAYIPAGTPSIDVQLTGSGKQTYELYINGEFYDTVTVEFGGNG